MSKTAYRLVSSVISLALFLGLLTQISAPVSARITNTSLLFGFNSDTQNLWGYSIMNNGSVGLNSTGKTEGDSSLEFTAPDTIDNAGPIFYTNTSLNISKALTGGKLAFDVYISDPSLLKTTSFGINGIRIGMSNDSLTGDGQFTFSNCTSWDQLDISNLKANQWNTIEFYTSSFTTNNNIDFSKEIKSLYVQFITKQSSNEIIVRFDNLRYIESSTYYGFSYDCRNLANGFGLSTANVTEGGTSLEYTAPSTVSGALTWQKNIDFNITHGKLAIDVYVSDPSRIVDTGLANGLRIGFSNDFLDGAGNFSWTRFALWNAFDYTHFQANQWNTLVLDLSAVPASVAIDFNQDIKSMFIQFETAQSDSPYTIQFDNLRFINPPSSYGFNSDTQNLWGYNGMNDGTVGLSSTSKTEGDSSLEFTAPDTLENAGPQFNANTSLNFSKVLTGGKLALDVYISDPTILNNYYGINGIRVGMSNDSLAGNGLFAWSKCAIWDQIDISNLKANQWNTIELYYSSISYNNIIDFNKDIKSIVLQFITKQSDSGITVRFDNLRYIAPITFDSYNVLNTIITKVQPETAISTFKNSLQPIEGVDVSITNSLSDSGFVGTGTTVDVTINGNVTQYIIVIYGDVDGDGKIDLSDLVAIRNSLLGTRTLSGVFNQAGDLYGEKSITLNDLVGVMSNIYESGTINQDV